jgi:glycosyltransferase involved in cell wall biosynthesis
LGEFLMRSSGSSMPVVVPMAADPEFHPRDRSSSRRHLGLPESAPLIGYFGSWAARRGTRLLLDVMEAFREQRPDARFVMTGRPPQQALSQPNAHALGYISDGDLPVAVCALNVSCVVTANTAFGRYSYPAKLCESIASGVPVTATATEPVRWMLAEHPEALVEIGDAAGFSKNLLARIDQNQHWEVPAASWADSANLLAEALDFYRGNSQDRNKR